MPMARSRIVAIAVQSIIQELGSMRCILKKDNWYITNGDDLSEIIRISQNRSRAYVFSSERYASVYNRSKILAGTMDGDIPFEIVKV